MHPNILPTNPAKMPAHLRRAILPVRLLCYPPLQTYGLHPCRTIPPHTLSFPATADSNRVAEPPTTPTHSLLLHLLRKRKGRRNGPNLLWRTLLQLGFECMAQRGSDEWEISVDFSIRLLQEQPRNLI